MGEREEILNEREVDRKMESYTSGRLRGYSPKRGLGVSAAQLVGSLFHTHTDTMQRDLLLQNG